MYHERRRNCGRKALLETNVEARAYVEEKLELGWSPEQISGRAKLEGKSFKLSYNKIYHAFDKGILKKGLKIHLRIKRVKNRKRRADDKRGKIPDTVSIHERPEAANQRQELGHWESDTVIGKAGTGCIGTHVERKTGYLLAFKMPDKQVKPLTPGLLLFLSTSRRCSKRASPLTMAGSSLLTRN